MDVGVMIFDFGIIVCGGFNVGFEFVCLLMGDLVFVDWFLVDLVFGG